MDARRRKKAAIAAAAMALTLALLYVMVQFGTMSYRAPSPEAIDESVFMHGLTLRYEDVEVDEVGADEVTPWLDFIAIGADGEDLNDMIEFDTLRIGAMIIPEVLDRDVGWRVAIAGCVDGRRVIAYEPRYMRTMTRRSFQFIRHHELAHHTLPHRRCPGRPPVPDSVQEREADCKAVEMLISRGEEGRYSIAAAAERFAQRGGAASSAYHSGASRSRYLTKWCEPL